MINVDLCISPRHLHALEEAEEATEAKEPRRLEEGENREVERGAVAEPAREELEGDGRGEVNPEPEGEVAPRNEAGLLDQGALLVNVRSAEVEENVEEEENVDAGVEDVQSTRKMGGRVR